MADDRTDAPLSAKERDELAESKFGDPEGKRYPLDDEEHVRAANTYLEKEHNAGRESDAKYKEIRARINAAMKKFKIGEENQDDLGATLETPAVSTDGGVGTPEGAHVEPKSDSAWKTVQRWDLQAGKLGKPTPSGVGIAVPARMTRTGVLTYRQDDGKIRRELRPPEEVFSPKSLATLSGATVTDDHPAKVHEGNYRQVTIGHVHGEPHQDGRYVAGELHIKHGPAVEKVRNDQLAELSCGYKCKLDETPGVYEGQPYDAVQRNIEYNHVAAGPVGWGRAGGEVRMRLDSRENTVDPLDGLVSESRADELPKVGGMAEEKTPQETPEQRSIREQSEAKARKDADDVARLTGELATMRTENERLQGEIVIARRRDNADAVEKQLTEEAARVDSIIAERLKLYEEGKVFLSTHDQPWSSFKADGKTLKSVRDVRAEIISAANPGMTLDKKDEPLIPGMYVASLNALRTRAEGERRRMIAEVAAGPRFDAKKPEGEKPGEEEDPDDMDEDTRKAQDAMFQKQKDAWKFPMRDRRRDRGGNRDSGKTVPMRSAFNGGNQGNNAGGFGGGT